MIPEPFTFSRSSVIYRIRRLQAMGVIETPKKVRAYQLWKRFKRVTHNNNLHIQMIHVNTINTTIEAKDSQPQSNELKGLADSIAAMSKTPEWQAYLLGLQEKEDKKKKRPKSGKKNV